MAVDSYGSKNEPNFVDTGAPDLAVDSNALAAYAAKVGNRRVGTTTERNAATGKDVWEGLEWQDTTDGMIYTRRSGSWVGGLATPTRLDATNSIVGCIVQRGFAFARGGGGPQLSIPVTFPVAFAGIPMVSVAEAGYRTNGTFNPDGLSTYIGTSWNPMGPSKTGFTASGQGTGNYVTTNWYYVQWIAIGAV